MTQIVYSSDGSEFGYQDDFGGFIDDNEFEVGAEYETATAEPLVASDYVKSHSLYHFLEGCDEGVSDDVEDYEEWSFCECTAEAKDELLQLVKDWADKNIKLNYWKPTNIRTEIIEMEDLE